MNGVSEEKSQALLAVAERIDAKKLKSAQTTTERTHTCPYPTRINAIAGVYEVKQWSDILK
jgi:hypothetical protein